MRRRSPLSPVGANDSPMAYCSDCGAKYNPYKHGLGDCPRCDDE